MFTAALGFPVVRWKEGELPSIVDQAEAALMESGLNIFQRDSPMTLVRIVQRQASSVRNYKRPPGVLGLVTVEPHYLSEQLTRCALWERFDARSKGWRRTNCPDKVTSTLMARGGEWKLPRLTGAISTPTLRPDGSILQKPGYDPGMRVYYDPCGVEYPEIPDKPDKRAAIAALDLLLVTFSSFPYQADVDKSVAMAAALTALVRRSLPAAPMIGISAPKPGSGKTLLADGISILATGTRAPAMTFARTDEEAQKTALSVLMQGDPVVLIDNIERPLEGDWLCSILTEETYSQRGLGGNEMVTVPTRTLFIATGNNLRVARDLRTRTLLCRVDAKMERPEQREFNYDFRTRMQQQRPEIVAAGLTLLRAFIVSGQHSRVYVKPWGRFEHWSDMVRAPLKWLGLADPCDSLDTIERSDPVRAEQLRVMWNWFELFGDRQMTAREVIRDVTGPGAADALEELRETLGELAKNKAGAWSAKRLGWWLENHKNSPIGMDEGAAGVRTEYQIERCQDRVDNTSTWRVVRIGKAPK